MQTFVRFQGQAENLCDLIKSYLDAYEANLQQRRDWVAKNVPPEKRTSTVFAAPSFVPNGRKSKK